MSSSDDDDDLKRAIALSLADSAPSPTGVVDLPSNSGNDIDEDEDLRRAIAISLEASKRADAVDSATGSRVNAKPQMSEYATIAPGANTDAQQQTEASTTTSISQPLGFLGLDRKAMERERLARLGKRKRSASPQRPSKLVTGAPTPPLRNVEERAVTHANGDTTLQYAKGTIKRTWACKHPRTNDIKIEEVLQSSTLNIAILSAFQFEDTWLFDKLDPEKAKQIWVMSAKGDDVRKKLLAEVEAAGIPNFRPHFPPMSGQVHSMHSKLMLLFHETHLRVVVPTANIIKVDWGETGNNWQSAVMENSAFLIDLPRRPDGKPAETLDTKFGKELLYFLEAQEMRSNLLEGLLKFDFSETQHIAFVHSIGGSHSDSNRSRTGLPGLSKAIRDLKLDQVEMLELDYAASALGAIKVPFLKQIYLAACGLPPLSDFHALFDFLDHFRIYFPTKETVVNSTGGINCGGIINLKRSDYNSLLFPRRCMRDYKSTRPGVLSHNKLLFARGRKKDGTPFAWVYVGSANLSESAWGSHKILKSGKEGKLNIRNWECGVIVPVPEEKLRGLDLGDGEVPPMGIFEGTVEVPFQYPAQKYEGKEPWFFQG